MSSNIELLDYIYQNSEMGTDTISQLMEINRDEEFAKHLQAQWSEYKAINNEAKRLLNESGVDEKGINSFNKLKTYLMVNMQTLTNATVPHIAEMLIVGSNMGVIDAIKKMDEYKENADHEIIDLMDRLKVFEENNIQRLKKYLVVPN